MSLTCVLLPERYPLLTSRFQKSLARDTNSTIPAVSHDATNTHAIASGVQNDVVNTPAIVSDSRRNALKSAEDTSDQNRLVSAVRTPLVVE